MFSGDSRNRHGVGEKVVAEVSDEESEKLSLFVDGELSEDEGVLLRRKIEGANDLLAAELSDFRMIRSELRSWHHAQLLDESGRERDVDLWARVEGDLHKGGFLRKSMKKQVAVSSLVNSVIESIGAAMRPAPVFAVICASLLCVFAFSLVDNQSLQGANREGKQTADREIFDPRNLQSVVYLSALSRSQAGNNKEMSLQIPVIASADGNTSFGDTPLDDEEDETDYTFERPADDKLELQELLALRSNKSHGRDVKFQADVPYYFSRGDSGEE